MKHKHAELMLAYATESLTDDKAYLNWQVRTDSSEWFDVSSHPLWHTDKEYRRKPKTVNINGYEVPESIAEYPMIDSTYYLVSTSEGICCHKWTGDNSDIEWLENGLIHANKEAAEFHLKALLSFTKQVTA